MKKWVVSVIVVLAIIAAAVGGYLLKSANTTTTTLKANQTAVDKPEVASKPPTRAELLKLVNAERKKAGVAPLKEDPRLDWSAQQKADDMQKYNYEGHESPKSPHDQGNARYWLLRSGILCSDTSENLQDETNLKPITPLGIVEVWKTSKSHYEAMISSKYTLTGFGITDNQTVEHFCQP